jgi:type I restriction enzyme, S subunit
MIPPGYKQTEVGVIPEDWESKKLEEYFSFISYGFTNPMPTVNHGVFMVTAADINDGRLQLDTARKTTETAYRTLLTPKSKPKKDDILLTKDGSLGRLALVGEEQICINQSVAIIRPNEKVEPLFLKLLLESPTYQKKMIDGAGGSTIKHIYITIVNLMPLGIPPDRTEQRAIATALSDVDGLLGALDRLIAKKRDLKQAAMQQLLTGQTRLPGFTGKWETKPFGRLYGEPSRNGVYKTSEFHGRGTRIVNMGEMFGFDFISDQEMNRVSLTTKEMATNGLRDGDLLFGRRSVVPSGAGKCSIVVNPPEPLIFESSIIRVRLNQEVADPLFHYYFFASPMGRFVMSLIISGTNVKGIRGSELRDLEIPHPPLPEQTAIATVLSDMDAELAALEQRREKTRALKQGMMQELLTGRTRLIG